MVPRLRPSLLAALFVLLFAVIANGAWATAITTTGPWYDAAASSDVYLIAAAVATLLSVVLVLTASRIAASMDASLRKVDRRVAILRAQVAPARVTVSASPPESPPDEFDLGSLTDRANESSPSSLVRLEREGHDTLLPMARPAASVRADASAELLRQLVAERVALREARTRVWAYTAGPVATSLVFLSIAGPMLPGAGPFAAAHFVLNTTLVLFLAYGLAPLVAWALLALGSAATASRPSPA